MHRFALLALPLLLACPGPSAPVPDGSIQTDAGFADPPDAGADAGADAGEEMDAGQPPHDAGFVVQSESEPNDGTTATELNDVLFPASLTGVIDPADDLDIFKVELVAAELWLYRLAPRDTSSEFRPHFAMSDHQHADDPPNLVVSSVDGGVAAQEHFVLSSGRYNFFVRDARNVPATSSQHVGGPNHTWQLTSERLTRTPTIVTIPSTTAATLPFTRAVGLYSFSTSAVSNVKVEVLAQTKTSPSNMDPQLSLYSPAAGGYVATNDDANATKDSRLEVASLPAGTHIVIIENLQPDATDLSYELRLSAF